MRRRVLVGYDGSPRSEDALNLARTLASALDASVMLTTVVDPARHGLDRDGFDRALERFSAELYAPARARLDRLEVLERPLVAASRSQAIHELAEWEQPMLIAIGSSRLAPAGSLIAGALGLSLLSGAPCPVVVAPGGYAESEPQLERVAVAVDGDAEGWRALSGAASLARRIGRPLDLVTVRPPDHYLLGGLLSPYDRNEYRKFHRREAEQVLTEAERRVPDGVESKRVLLEGDPADTLAEASGEFDLLVVGSRGHGPVTGVMLGSVSAKLMISARAPVMVLARGVGHRLADW